jgi:hypothetical protein
MVIPFDPRELAFSKILVGVDGSEESILAAGTLSKWLRRMKLKS